MKLYHRLNQILLERYPTLWNTQFVWVMGLGLLMHLLFFAIGYATLDLALLKSYSVRNYFFTTPILSIYLVLFLVVFIFAAFRYFSHNPFRHFYPLRKAYLWKVFGLVCIEGLVLLSVYTSYETGMKLKADGLVSDKEIVRDIKTINSTFPFFFNEISEYHITKRSWPKPFPLEELSDFTIGYDSANHLQMKHGINFSKPHITLGGKQFQFGVLGNKTIDSCSTESVIEKYVDVSKVYGIQEYSLLNFSNTFISRFKDSVFNATMYIPEVHRVYLSHSVDTLREQLKSLERIALRYHLANFWDAQRMAETIFRQNLDEKTLIRVGIVSKEQLGAAVEENEGNGIRKNIAYNYFMNLNEFLELVNNKENLDERMGYHQFQTDSFWILVCMSMLGAFLLLLFKYLPIKEILIGTVVTGIITAIASSILFFFSQIVDSNDVNQYNSQEMRVMSITSMICMLVVIHGLYRIFSNGTRKKWAIIFFIPFITGLLIFIPASYNYLHLATMKQVKLPCQNDFTWEEIFKPMPSHIFLLYLLALGIIFYLWRRLQAKSE